MQNENEKKNEKKIQKKDSTKKENEAKLFYHVSINI